MKKVIQYIFDVFSQVMDSISDLFKPINKWLANVAMISTLRSQFSCVAGRNYADALSPVIDKLSCGYFWLKRDLWLAAIEDVKNNGDPVETLLRFDRAAFDPDGFALDLISRLQTK